MKPWWAPIWLICKSCRHAWDDWQPQQCPIDTWVTHVKTYRCPNCGKRGLNIYLRMTPLEAPDDQPP